MVASSLPICFPPASGVPFASGPPWWWDTTGGSLPALNQREDDPRWRGSTRRGFDGPWASQQGEEAGFRALSNPEPPGQGLYLSWTIKADNSLDPAEDRIVVGFRTPGKAYLFRLEPFPLQGPGAFVPLAVTRMFEVGGASSPAPAWVGARGRVLAGATTWTIQLHVPVRSGGPEVDAAGIQLASTFKFYFEVRVKLAGVVNPYTLRYPAAANDSDASTWDDATIGGTGCGQHVATEAWSIRTTNNPPHRIKFGSNFVNTLVVDARNNTGSQIGSDVIRSRFWIANWGSIPNDPNNATNLWAPIPPPASGPGSNPNPINDGTTGEIRQTWVVDGQFLTDFQNGLRWEHQCLLCELSGGNLTYSPASTQNNFELAVASRFERDAQISVRGLPDPGTAERDVYLLVTTTNMPERVEQRPPPGPAPDLRAVRGKEDGEDGDGEFDPYATDLSGFDLIRRDEPTYVVHVFNDSGPIDPDTGVPTLVAQTPFGYAVGHDGPLHGWEHSLTGARLTQVGPNLYRLRAPTGGEAVVTTRIEALERPRSWLERLLRWLLRLLRRLLRKLLGR
jgi:hypothetical protein